MRLAIVLVLLGSFAHAGWNLLAVAGRRDARGFLLASTLVVAALCLPAAAVRFLLDGSLGIADLRHAALLGVVSGLLHTSYAAALQAAYSRGDVGVVYPLARGVGPLLAVLGGWLLLAEEMTVVRWLGVVIVLAGVAVAALDERTEETATSSRTVAAGVAGGLVVGLTIAAYTMWDDFSVSNQDADPVAYYAITVLVQLAVLITITGDRTRRVRAALRTTPAAVLGVGVLVPASYLLVLAAMTMAPLTVVAPLRATSVVIGAVGAAVLLREGSTARRLVAAGLVCVGIVGVGWPT